MKFLRRWKYLITGILLVIIIGFFIYTKMYLKDNEFDEIEESPIVKTEPIIDEIVTSCHIDIKGAVLNPGVYDIDCDKRVADAISLAGGVTNKADTSIINLAKKITDEMVIIVYTKEEVANSNIINTVIKEIEKECVCPNIQNDGCINTDIDETIPATSNLININTATSQELQRIPGIGASKAKAIINYREQNNGFQNISDLLKVDGIGEKLYEEIKIYITV